MVHCAFPLVFRICASGMTNASVLSSVNRNRCERIYAAIQRSAERPEVSASLVRSSTSKKKLMNRRGPFSLPPRRDYAALKSIPNRTQTNMLDECVISLHRRTQCKSKHHPSFLPLFTSFNSHSNSSRITRSRCFSPRDHILD